MLMAVILVVGIGPSLKGVDNNSLHPRLISRSHSPIRKYEHMNLEGKVAVVTGGSYGIGRATAIALAKAGADVYCGDLINNEENDMLYAELGIFQRPCDVTDESDVVGLIEQAVSPSGNLDILVNNAGVGLIKQIPDVSEAEWDHVMGINLKGAFLCCKHAIPYMQPTGGSIINVASNAGILPRVHDPVYSTSKGALIAFTKSLALCHSKDKIRVNTVCPGPVGNTRMMLSDLESTGDFDAAFKATIAASPMAQAEGRMIDVEEIAAAILYLASDEARFVTGTDIAIDGGKSLGVPPKL